MASIYTTEAIRFLQNLIQIPSVTGEYMEKDIIQFIMNTCDQLNLPYKVFEKEK